MGHLVVKGLRGVWAVVCGVCAALALVLEVLCAVVEAVCVVLLLGVIAGRR
jgi:hypothetical protein